jgi:hypothetical protein
VASWALFLQTLIFYTKRSVVRAMGAQAAFADLAYALAREKQLRFGWPL